MLKQNFGKLIILILAQFFCTSLWFAPNSVIEDLISTYNLEPSSLGALTSSLQFGFIIGTLIFAIFTIADRFSPSKTFFICATIGALLNLSTINTNNNYESLLIFRFLTGVSLAGIYPIGMKIAADYSKEGLGTALGYLVGALVLGTSFPHFIKSINQNFSWETVIIATSSLAFIGGLIVLLFIPDGPFRQKNNKPNFKTFFTLFKNNKFRISAFGYFGHMWELYAFWTFIPLIISMYLKKQPSLDYSISLLSFFIIAIGSLACITAGYLSVKFETKIVARTFLVLSAICCLLSPLFYQLSPPIFFIFLLFWGFVVIGDSPLFSTLVAQNTSSDTKGTALTIVNSIGFTITIISIQLITYLLDNTTSIYLFTLLAIGPILGLIGLFTKTKKRIV